MHKTGDKVVVKSNLLPGRWYGDNCFITEMQPLLGKIVTIKRVAFDNQYNLIEDRTGCSWTNEMFRKVETNSK